MSLPITIRTDLRPNDLQSIIESIVDLHGVVYEKECAWDVTFKDYVAGPLMDFAKRPSQRNRIWLAERDGKLIGCIAIVEATVEDAQLRWFVVAPEARQEGLGSRLMHDAVAFAREQGYARLFLWTEASLKAAARLYARSGFEKKEEKRSSKWGANVIEERWEMMLGSAQS
jgi:N-acetylglutamate synthase-like GNAT family acetyltransferase